MSQHLYSIVDRFGKAPDSRSRGGRFNQPEHCVLCPSVRHFIHISTQEDLYLCSPFVIALALHLLMDYNIT